MIPRLQEVDPRLAHQVDESMLLGDAPRPAATEVELERLGLADAAKRIPHDGFYQIKDAQRRLAVCSDPEAKIFPQLRVEDGRSGAVTEYTRRSRKDDARSRCGRSETGWTLGVGECGSQGYERSRHSLVKPEHAM